MSTTVTPLRHILGLLSLLFLPLLLQAQAVDKSAMTRIGVKPDPAQFAPPSSARFTENRGQLIDTDGKLRPDLLYKGGSRGVDLYFSKRGISYVFSRLDGELHPECGHAHHKEEGHHDGDAHHEGHADHDGHDHEPATMQLYRADLEFVGANTDVKVIAEQPYEDYTNYFHEHCPDGITGVKSFKKLTYQDIYPNIDLVVYANENGTKSDFIVRPGGRVSDIRLRYTGADQTELLNDGSLRMVTPLGYLEDDAPYTYQERAGVKGNPIRSAYRIANGVISFTVGKYDQSRPLVIDPQQIWATFYGGSNSDQFGGGDPTEVDRSGNVMIVGYTTSNPFPVVAGHQMGYGGGGTLGDMFLVKFNGRGLVQWATYYGGSNDDLGHGVSSDKHGNVFIIGHTSSSTVFFPLNPEAFDVTYGGGDRDAIVAKFDPNGAHLWSTYIGGLGTDDGYGFAIDSNDNVAALVTTNVSGQATIGQTAHHGDFDILIIKFSPNGPRQWSTYFGGTSEEYGYAAASDIEDNIIFTGWTSSNRTTASTSFPVLSTAHQPNRSGDFDAFVAKFSSNGSRLWATYYGGTGRENKGPGSPQGYCGITTDGEKNVLIAGTTASSNFPVSGPFSKNYGTGGSDAFIVKFNEGGVLQWATCVGGTGTDIGTGVAANPIGGALITGFTNSPAASFPVKIPPNDPTSFMQSSPQGSNDAYIVKLASTGEQQWGTYFGGSGDDQGHGISFNPHGFIIIAGMTRSTSAFPFTKARVPEGIAQGSNAGQLDAFVSVFCDPVPPAIDSSGPKTLCHDEDITLSLVEDGYTQVGWYKVPSTTPFSTQNSVTITDSGRYYVKIESAGGCPAQSDTIKIAKFGKLNPTIAGVTSVCTGDSINLSAVGGPYAKYTWKRNDIVIPDATTSILKVKQGGTYKVLVENSWGCKDSSDNHIVIEHPMPTPVSVTPADTVEICQGLSATLTANGGVGGTIEWSNGSGGSTLNVTEQGFYFARAINVGTGCSTVSNRVFVKVNPKPKFNITALLPLEFCEGDSTVLVASVTDYAKYVWTSPNGTEEGVTRIVVRKSGTVTLVVTDSKGCTNQAEVVVTMYERPTPKIAQTGPIIKCEGDSVMLSLTGGSFTSVLWSNGSIGMPAKITKSGKYYAIVTGPGGCRENSDTIDVTFTPAPDAKISGPGSVCTNSSGSYSVPNQPGATYVWEVTGTGASLATGQNTPNIDVNWGPTGTGTVKVTVTHTASGCKATSTMTVTVGSVLVPTITVRPKSTLCPGDSTVLDAGPNYVSYAWSNGETSRTITVRQPGTYTVTVANAGGCSGTSDPVTITMVDAPKPTIVPSRSTTLCPGDTVFLSVSAPFDDYLWSGGQTIDRIAVSQPGSYTVTVVDANGCRGTSDPIEVTMATPPAPVITGPNSVCINSTQTYSVTAVSGDIYLWEVAGGLIVGQSTNNSVSVQWPTAGPGLIKVTQTSGSFGCVDSAFYNVTVGTSLQPQISASGSTLICPGDSITLMAPEGYASYLWDDGSTTRTIVVAQPRTYTVTVTDNGGCSGSGEIVISEKPPLAPKIVPDGRPGLCPGDSLRLEATAGFNRYLWSTGDTTQAIWVKQAGSYTVTVFDADSCSDISGVVDVVVYPLISTPIIQAIGDTLVALVDTVDSPKPAGYQWTLDGQVINGANAQKLYASVIGAYTVTVVDSNGCIVTSAEFTPTAFASATVGLPIIEAAPGERVKIPITLMNSENLERNKIEQFEGELRYDKSLLILADPRFTSTVVGNQQVVRITGNRPATMSTGELLTIDFIAALGDKTTTPLELRTFAWSDALGSVPVTIQQGRFDLIDICETGGRRLLDASGNVAIKAVRPNPAVASAEVEYEVNEHGYTQLYIVDLLGRRVAVLVDGEVQPGSYAVPFNASQLATGTYFCILETPTVRLHHLMQIEK